MTGGSIASAILIYNGQARSPFSPSAWALACQRSLPVPGWTGVTSLQSESA